MIVKVTIALLCFAFTTVSCQTVCGTIGPLWQNDNQTCPPRAICGDVFTFTRDWLNGRRCNETRILSNCLCPGNTVCPFHDDSYALRSSATHRQYTCLPSCRLPWCLNVHLAPSDDSGRPRGSVRGSGRGRGSGSVRGSGNGRGRLRHDEVVVSMTSEQRAPDFGSKTYNKMDCRCPQHVQIAPRRQRAVRAYSYRYNWDTHTYSTVYVCNNRWGQNDMHDPCV